MLTKQNCGKYLSDEYQRKRAEALAEPEKFSTSDLAWLDVESADYRRDLDPEAYRIETTPVDTSKKSASIDLRETDVTIAGGD